MSSIGPEKFLGSVLLLGDYRSDNTKKSVDRYAMRRDSRTW